MTKRINFPLNIGDFRRDTMHLGPYAVGCYFNLLCYYWDRGGLPDDKHMLRRIAGADPGVVWEQTFEVLHPLFRHPGWRHKRVDAELAKHGKFSEKMRGLAKRRWDRSLGDKPATREHIRNVGKSLKTLAPKMRGAMLSLKESKDSLERRFREGVEKRQPSKQENGAPTRRERQAHQAWLADLSRQLGSELYAEAIDLLAANPELIDRADAAELRVAHSGAQAAMIGLKGLLEHR